MAKHWFVSCHASVDHKKSNSIRNIIFGSAETLIAPPGMEIVFYCPDNAQLSMVGGWKLWDMLMFNDFGGEPVAYAAAYKTGRQGGRLTNFTCFMDPNDFNHWDDGPTRGNNHAAMNAYGIWEVGNITAPAIDLRHYPAGITLAQIVGEAAYSGVTRIYWGCCKAHIKASGAITTASNNVYTPSGLR